MRRMRTAKQTDNLGLPVQVEIASGRAMPGPSTKLPKLRSLMSTGK